LTFNINCLFSSDNFRLSNKNTSQKGGAMQKILCTFLVVFLVSSFGIAEMKLKLRSDLIEVNCQSIFNKNLESNLKLQLPEQVTPPADMKDIVKGMILLGILADVSFPLGGDEGFGHVAKTGFSGHVMFGYAVSTAVMLAVKAGYIKFGTNTTEESIPGVGDFNYEDSFSMIPILFGAYYMFATGSAFKPYLGLALGVFIQNYSYTWTYNYNFFGQTQTETEEGDASSTGFGIVPGAGFYYMLGSVMLAVAVEYAYIFSDLPSQDEEEYTPSLGKLNGIAQEVETSSSEKASYFSVNVGVAFPLGK
jgi:outer membrane protein W